jgi:hypothetical protein
MDHLLVSTRKGLIIFKNSKAGWKPAAIHFNGIPVSYTYYDKERNHLWAFQDHGHWGMKISRSQSFGKSWEEIPSPVYPEGTEVKPNVPASLRYIWAARHLPHDHKDTFLIGTEPGGLFHWNEEKMNWDLNAALWNQPGRQDQWFGGGRDFPGIHSIIVDPKDAKHWYIAISCAGVFETINAGQSWQVRNKGLRADFLPDPYAEIGHDPHLVTICDASPHVIWQQNHCGIFRSEDAGKNWADITQKDGPANFGFAIAAHESNENIAWVAPGISDEVRVAVDHALCICRTEDGGKSWTALRSGLPQTLAFDIVYRHALVSLDTTLFFGTTTGNLFHSCNGGDHWDVISNHLPMVYALEIASPES